MDFISKWVDALLLSISTPIVAATFGVIVISTLVKWASRKQDNSNDNKAYTVQQCPNPDCIRCRKYVQVNRSAQRRFPWVVRDLTKQSKLRPGNTGGGASLSRVEDAIRLGPKVASQERNFQSQPLGGPAPVGGQYPTVLLIRGLSAIPVVTALHSEACRTLRKNDEIANLREAMLDEYIYAHKVVSGRWLENDVNDEGKWEVLHLLNQGEWIEENVTLCPKTAFLVRQLPHLMDGCIFGNVFVSVLEPGTIIGRHCGPSNVRHRLHFALQIPSGQSHNASGQVIANETPATPPELSVLDQVLTWTEGECFVFDDSLAHSVSYPATSLGGKRYSRRVESTKKQLRAVLIVDLWHPELSELEREAIKELYPASRQRSTRRDTAAGG